MSALLEARQVSKVFGGGLFDKRVTVALDDFTGAPALLVIFLCNHCPFVKHVRHELARLAREYQGRGVAVALGELPEGESLQLQTKALGAVHRCIEPLQRFVVELQGQGEAHEDPAALLRSG